MGMSREIKFRAWIKRKNELIYLRGFRYSGNEKIKITFADEDEDDCTYTFLSKDVVLEQFTGLHDKNGVEVYENDKIFDGKYYGIIEYMECSFVINWEIDCSHDDDLNYWNDKIEVIGNIHERSEDNDE
jgi:uncharacterized phage protein (TIGR01671 family)